MSEAIQLYDTQGRRLYLASAERDAFLDAATLADRPARTLCAVLYYTGCRISEALALTPRRIDIGDQVVTFESLKKRRRGVYRAVPVPGTL
jgi:integrase/recombinase XerD